MVHNNEYSACLPRIPRHVLEFQTRVEIHPQEGRDAAIGTVNCGGIIANRLGKTPGRPECNHLDSGRSGVADYVFHWRGMVARDSARAVISRCKENGVKVVAGGPLFTMEHDQFPEVDTFVLNEELTLFPFLADSGQRESPNVSIPPPSSQTSGKPSNPSFRRVSSITIQSASSSRAVAPSIAISAM